jgi:hypothetical protein
MVEGRLTVKGKDRANAFARPGLRSARQTAGGRSQDAAPALLPEWQWRKYAASAGEALQTMCMPPETLIASPVMKSDSDEAR